MSTTKSNRKYWTQYCRRFSEHEAETDTIEQRATGTKNLRVRTQIKQSVAVEWEQSTQRLRKFQRTLVQENHKVESTKNSGVVHLERCKQDRFEGTKKMVEHLKFLLI